MKKRRNFRVLHESGEIDVSAVSSEQALVYALYQARDMGSYWVYKKHIDKCVYPIEAVSDRATVGAGKSEQKSASDFRDPFVDSRGGASYIAEITNRILKEKREKESE